MPLYGLLFILASTIVTGYCWTFSREVQATTVNIEVFRTPRPSITKVMAVWLSSCMIASTGSTFHKGSNTNCVCWPSNAFTNLLLDICRGTEHPCHLSLVSLNYDLQLLVNLWFHFQKLKLLGTKGSLSPSLDLEQSVFRASMIKPCLFSLSKSIWKLFCFELNELSCNLCSFIYYLSNFDS